MDLGSGTHIIVFAQIDFVLSASSAAAFNDAARVMRPLTDEGVEIVLCSGKTRAELEHIRDHIGVSAPFVCEYGGAVVVPDHCFSSPVPDAREIIGHQVVEFGRSHASVADILRRTAARLRIEIRGFSDMSVDEVARECHLSLLQARLAKLREYGEMFCICDPSPITRNRLFRALRAEHLRCTSQATLAGRRTARHQYEHVGAAVDFGIAVGVLGALYRREGSFLTAGCDDSTSDLLRLVDCPIIVDTEGVMGTARGSVKSIIRAVDVAEWMRGLADVVRNVRRGHPLSRTVTAG